MNQTSTQTRQAAQLGGADRTFQRVDGCEPFIRPEGIQWRGGVDGKPLLLELTFENPHREPTVPTPAVLRVADFGAFRPWTPLRTLVVPSVPPRGRMTLRVDLESGEQVDLARRGTSTENHFAELKAEASRYEEATSAQTQRYLEPLDRRRSVSGASFPWTLPGFEQERTDGTPLHFVGNFDLKVGHQQPVERHCGDLEGLQPNCTNVTYFNVGDGLRDTYTFRVAECDPEWKVELRVKLPSSERLNLHEGASIEIAQTPAYVVITPAPDSKMGEVAVEVHRARTDQSALVEFKLKTTAAV